MTSTYGVCAQTSFLAGPHLSAGSKTERAGVGIGAGIEVARNISFNGAFILSSGYTQFPKGYNGRVRYVPLRLGYRYSLLQRLNFQAEVGSGTFFYPGYDYSRFSYASGIGYLIPLPTNFLRLSAVYEHTNDNAGGYFGWVTYRLAYGFAFKRKGS